MFWKSHGIEKKDLLTPASILLGAILISVTIYFSFARVGGGSVAAKTQPAAAAGDVKTVIKERKDAPREGKGKVTMIEFADFQCTFCQSFYNDSYKQIKAEYIDTGKVKFEFRHYPLPFHANAQISAEAAECANRQDKFFPYHDILFQRGQADGTGLTSPELKNYASELGLDRAKFDRCLDGGEATEVVKADYAAGTGAGVSGTPSMFINGKIIVGNQPFTVFKQALDAAL